MKNATRMVLLVGMASILALAAAPAATAHIGVHADLNGDGDCSDDGETIVSRPMPKGTSGHVFVNVGSNCRAY